MTCKETIARVTDYCEGILSSSEAQGIEAHLATCDKCRSYFEHARQMINAMGKLPEPSSLSPQAKKQLLRAFREQQSRTSIFTRKRPWAIAAVAVTLAVLIAIIWIIKIRTAGTVPTQNYKLYAVDFSKQLLLRGAPNANPGPPTPIPRARLNLVIHLGLGSPPGPYGVVLEKNGKAYAAATGTTKLQAHKPTLRVKVDFSQAPSGEYQLGIRPAGWDWRYYRVLLK
jgi:Putative zinc-finger